MVDSSGNSTTEESETGSEKIEVSGSDGDDKSWISWFCSLRGNEFFCEVDEEYIREDFNLHGLSRYVNEYDEALDMMLDIQSSPGDMSTDEEHKEWVKSSAEVLYGLIHARYILTSKGMASMLEKYENNDFGTCPRALCGAQPCLPVGVHDVPGQSSVFLFCPKCQEMYHPRSNYHDLIDGSCFGTTFPHLFLMTYGHLKPQEPTPSYVPKVFGFKLHKP